MSAKARVKKSILEEGNEPVRREASGSAELKKKSSLEEATEVVGGAVSAFGHPSVVEFEPEEGTAVVGDTSLSNGAGPTPLPKGFPSDCAFFVFIGYEAFEVRHSGLMGRKPFAMVEDEDCEGNKLKKYHVIIFLHILSQDTSKGKNSLSHK